MPTIHDTPPAAVQTDLNSLAQALDTIVRSKRVPVLETISKTIESLSNNVAPQLDPIMTDYIANAKTIQR